jgi:hypothetical protein
MQAHRVHHSTITTAAFYLFILGMVPAILRASSIDPRISVGDPSSGTALSSGTFSFKSDGNGGGTLNFINESGNTWTTLDFFVTLPGSDTIACSSSLYSFCNYTETSAGNGKSLFDIGFEQPNQQGITPGSAFSIDLNDAVCEDKGSWGPFVTMNAIANLDIPEPESARLALAGLLICLIGATYRRFSA